MTLIRALSWVGAIAFCSLIILGYFNSETHRIDAQVLGVMLFCISPTMLALIMHTRFAHKRIFLLIVLGFWTTCLSLIHFSYVSQEYDITSRSIQVWRGYRGIYHSLARDWDKGFSVDTGMTILYPLISVIAPFIVVVILVHLSLKILRDRRHPSMTKNGFRPQPRNEQ